jgi:hypothetical protein
MKKTIESQFERVFKLPKNQFVANDDWQNSSGNIDVILIGDNPGNQEFKSKKFSQGGTRNIVNLLLDNFQKNGKSVLVMNKSNYYTPNTKALNEILDKKISHPSLNLIKEDIEENARFLENMGENAEIILFGVSKSTLTYLFFESLTNNTKNKIIQLKHPSYNNLAAQIGEYLLKEINSKEPIQTDLLDIFKKIKSKSN